MNDKESCFLDGLKKFWDKPGLPIQPGQYTVIATQCGIDLDDLQAYVGLIGSAGLHRSSEPSGHHNY